MRSGSRGGEDLGLEGDFSEGRGTGGSGLRGRPAKARGAESLERKGEKAA